MAVSPEVSAELARQTQAVLDTLPESLAHDIKFDLDNGLIDHHSVAYNPAAVQQISLRWLIVDHELGHQEVAEALGIPVTGVEAHDRWGVTYLGPLRLRSPEDLLNLGAATAAGEEKVQDSTGTGSDRAQIANLAAVTSEITGGRISPATFEARCRSKARSLRRPRSDALFKHRREKLRRQGRI